MLEEVDDLGVAVALEEEAEELSSSAYRRLRVSVPATPSGVSP